MPLPLQKQKVNVEAKHGSGELRFDMLQNSISRWKGDGLKQGPCCFLHVHSSLFILAAFRFHPGIIIRLVFVISRKSLRRLTEICGTFNKMKWMMQPEHKEKKEQQCVYLTKCTQTISYIPYRWGADWALSCLRTFQRGKHTRDGPCRVQKINLNSLLGRYIISILGTRSEEMPLESLLLEEAKAISSFKECVLQWEERIW